jgi:hypothetical protein
VGALATGYGLVKSLQGNQPKLKEGTPYLRRGTHPQGTDTIPVMANEGEAIIPTDKNKAYHPVIKAIYEGTIPPQQLNHFVTTFHKMKPVPQVNYERIKEAAEMHIGHDGKMSAILNEHSALLKENNELQRAILRKQVRVENRFDRDGITSMVTEFLEQKKIDSKL